MLIFLYFIGLIVYNVLRRDVIFMEYSEENLKENKKRNKKFIKEFDEWLTNKGLSNKTIENHVGNAHFYINDYLNYYEITKMEDGMNEVYSFLNGWFIDKCLWATKNSLKEMSASIKKFYECMSELGYISFEDYKEMCSEIKDNMDEFLSSLDDYDNGTYYDIF